MKHIRLKMSVHEPLWSSGLRMRAPSISYTPIFSINATPADPLTPHEYLHHPNQNQTGCPQQPQQLPVGIYSTTMTTTRTTIRKISIQIPDGTDPGDTLEFQVDGQSLGWVVPVGSQSGDVVEIQVLVQDEDENEDEDSMEARTGINDDEIEALSFEIPACRDTFRLEFALTVPDDVCYDNLDGTITTRDTYNSCDDDGSDGTSALPWQSGIVLAKNWRPVSQFLRDKDIHSKSRVLELGSGLGVVGISLASSPDVFEPHSEDKPTSFVTESAKIVLTDVPAAVPLLDFNVAVNRHFGPVGVTVSTQTLRWSLEGPEAATPEPPYDCLLGSDLLYNLEEIPKLVATMKRLLHPLRGVVLLAVRWRKPELEREFFKTSGLEWELIPLPFSSGIFCPLLWNEFGNPSCEASNKYFHQTQVSLNATPTSIGDISEEQARGLPEREFKAWDRSFVQIYLGRPKGPN